MATVDLNLYKGREQEYVKHRLLEDYLPELGYRVGRAWDALVYVDAFAGPWQSTHDQFEDASFGVAGKAIKRCVKGLQSKWQKSVLGKCVFVEKDDEAFPKLEEYARSLAEPGFQTKAFHGDFVGLIPEIVQEIQSAGSKSFKFVFIDPKGWVAIPMRPLKSLLRERGCEVLINLMTKHMIRFLDQPDRARSFIELFGSKDALERVEALVREYCRSLRTECNFKHVSEAVILEPGMDKIRYFLIFATNHPRGVSVFKDAECHAAEIQNEVRKEKHIAKTKQATLDFAEEQVHAPFTAKLRLKYKRLSKLKCYDYLVSHAHGVVIKYEELFCKCMAFPLVTPDDLESWLLELGNLIEIKLAPPRSRRKLSAENADTVLVKDPISLRKVMEALERE